jgi:predicted NBD/HSP70 family sugar kinase/biotin operon repressor
LNLNGTNAEQAAAQNRRLVLAAIHRAAPLSRTELARRCGLTKQAIARIVDRLVDDGLVMEARRRHGLPGQPAIELEIDPEGLFSIGADIDRDHLTVVAVDARGTVRGRVHHERRFMLPGEFIVLLEDALLTFHRRKLVDEGRVSGIGLAIPDWLGEVPVTGRPETYAEWTGFDVRRAVEAITPHPVFIDNDVDASAIGEIDYGLGSEIGSFFYILANACLGGALVIDGVRHKGAGGLDGEIGWLPAVAGEGPAAGQIQPLGEFVSLFRLYDWLDRNGIRVATPAELMALDARGRALVSAWLRKAAFKIAEPIAHIGMIVDPEAVLIGELLIDVHQELARLGGPAPALRRAACSEDAAALGAAAMPLAHRFGLPSANPAQRTRVPLRQAPAAASAA